MSIAADKQKLVPGRRVELFDLDLTSFPGGLVYRFCSAGRSGAVAARKVLVQTIVPGTTSPGVNEQQLLTLSPETNDGVFSLIFDGNTSLDLPWSATADEVQVAMNAIAGTGNTLCTGVSVRMGGVTVKFQAAWGNQNVAPVTVNNALTSPDNTPLQWRGNAYVPIPMSAEGFEVSGRGSLPTPSIKIANVGLLPSAIIAQHGDPIGSKLTRWVTYSDYLDDGPLANPNEHYLPEIWLIERKKAQNRLFVEFELSAAMDQAGRMLPGRQVLRDACVLRYRTYDATLSPPAFVYNQTDQACPWAGHPSIFVTVSEEVKGKPSPATNEQQLIFIPVDADEGTFRLIWRQTTSSPIVFNPSVAAIQAVLDIIVGSGRTICTSYSIEGGSGYLVEFIGALAATDLTLLGVDSSLTSSTEGPFFTKIGGVTGDPAKDQCGKKLSDCKLRFARKSYFNSSAKQKQYGSSSTLAAIGTFTGILPFGGFPGVGRIKVE